MSQRGRGRGGRGRGRGGGGNGGEKQVCKFFMQGECSFGNDCRYLHPSGNDGRQQTSNRGNQTRNNGQQSSGRRSYSEDMNASFGGGGGQFGNGGGGGGGSQPHSRQGSSFMGSGGGFGSSGQNWKQSAASAFGQRPSSSGSNWAQGAEFSSQKSSSSAFGSSETPKPIGAFSNFNKFSALGSTTDADMDMETQSVSSVTSTISGFGMRAPNSFGPQASGFGGSQPDSVPNASGGSSFGFAGSNPSTSTPGFGASGGFGTSSGFGTNKPSSTPAFGASSGFGASNPSTTPAFGSSSGFGGASNPPPSSSGAGGFGASAAGAGTSKPAFGNTFGGGQPQPRTRKFDFSGSGSVFQKMEAKQFTDDLYSITLTEEEQKAFEAKEFELGKIPLNPPEQKEHSGIVAEASKNIDISNKVCISITKGLRFLNWNFLSSNL
jgi:hypothetical protein